MFGYVTPVKSGLRQQDFVLFRAFYCGVCTVIGKNYGSLPRFTTSYDIAFLSALLHDVTAQDVEFVEARCVGNPFQKKVVVKSNPLLERISAANVVLGYYKLCDDIIDGGGSGKRLARAALKKAYKKAVTLVPQVDESVKNGYERLRILEKKGEKGIDISADCFAGLLKDTVDAITEGKAGDKTLSLCYNIGKFVYLIDALDDVGEDSRNKNYNPFLAAYGDFTTRREFFDRHADEIGFAINSTVNRAIECFNGMSFTQSYTLLQNVIYYGLREKAKQVLDSDKKIPAPKL